MPVYNVHARSLKATPRAVGTLLDGLSGPQDALWPSPPWPPLRLDGPLAVGAAGGHGPVRYTVTAYVPGHWTRFRFSGPRGFDGFHELVVQPDGEHCVLRHTLAMRLRGPARLSWPLFYRHLHDALLEDALDRAEAACHGRVTAPARRTPYVRLLRLLAARRRTPPRSPGKET